MSDDSPVAPGPDAMKPATAAKKLGIYLPAAPAAFRDNAISHAQFQQLQNEPPAWLVDLRVNGPTRAMSSPANSVFPRPASLARA